MKRVKRPLSRAWRPLPRCRCGKAIYATEAQAERQRRTLDLEAAYRCRFGNYHMTSQALRSRRPARKGPPVILTCPVCAEVATDGDPASLVDELASCPHPVHWPDRDPARPYFPEIAVQLTGQDGNVFIALGLVDRALRRAEVDPATIEAYGKDFTSSEDYSAALGCAQRWVDIS